jgi:hypothetical protein
VDAIRQPHRPTTHAALQGAGEGGALCQCSYKRQQVRVGGSDCCRLSLGPWGDGHHLQCLLLALDMALALLGLALTFCCGPFRVIFLLMQHRPQELLMLVCMTLQPSGGARCLRLWLSHAAEGGQQVIQPWWVVWDVSIQARSGTLLIDDMILYIYAVRIAHIEPHCQRALRGSWSLCCGPGEGHCMNHSMRYACRLQG